MGDEQINLIRKEAFPEFVSQIHCKLPSEMKSTNTYTITMLCVSVSLIQLWNLVNEFNKIWYTHNFVGGAKAQIAL